MKRAEFANRLLARTGELVSHSTDYRATLERVADAAGARVRGLVLDRDRRRAMGPLERVAIAHRDPARSPRPADAARALSAARCDETSDRRRPAHGRAVLIRVDRRVAARDRRPTTDHLELLREIGCSARRSSLPMTAGGRDRSACSCSSTRRTRGASTHTTSTIADRGRAARRPRDRERPARRRARRGSPTPCSGSCCRRACRGCPAGRWRPCTSPRAR